MIDSNSDFRNLINEKGFYVCTTKGKSMLPMLRSGKDCICVKKPVARLKKFDVALYERKNGVLVLHRVLEVNENGYTMCGDNQYVLEHNVSDKQIIAVLSEFYRGNRKISCNNFWYKIYVNFWCSSLSFRKVLLNIIWFIENVFRKIWKINC